MMCMRTAYGIISEMYILLRSMLWREARKIPCDAKMDLAVAKAYGTRKNARIKQISWGVLMAGGLAFEVPRCFGRPETK